MNFFTPLAPWPFEQPFRRGFSLLVVDPPWRFEHRSVKGWGRSAEGKYKTMPTAEIAALPIGDMAADDCLLLCWATAPRLPDALHCVRAWGFDYVSMLTWQKVSKNGKQMRGLGLRVIGMSEPVLVATRGAPKHKPLLGLFPGERREHSRKPESFYAMVDRQCAGLTRRADVFARTERPGWAAYGDELEKFAEAPS
jgi:N6-adenosine-specific RNA methylase IME4